MANPGKGIDVTQPNPVNYALAAAKVSSGQWRVDPDLGLIYGVKGAAFHRTNTWGYTQIKFRDPDNWRVEHAALAHRVIWESVHGPLSVGLTINHLNGIKTDNRMANMEAVTQAENARHARATGLNVARVGEADAHSVLTDVQAMEIYTRAWSGERQAPIAAAYGISIELVSNIKRGWGWVHVTGHRAHVA